MKFTLLFAGFVALVLASAPPGLVAAQVAYTLRYPLAPPGATVREQGLAAFGTSVAMEGSLITVGAPYSTSVTEPGVVKVFDSTTGALVYVLTSPAAAPGDSFGTSVAISGTRVVASAPGWFGAGRAGIAYVYDLSSARPTVPVATLNNPGAAAEDHFGWSVAISGTRVVVGSHFDDTGASNAGSAYVYDLTSAAPTMPVATLHNPSPADGDLFGLSVAISGTRVVVGAYSDDTGASGAGSAYVYDLSGAAPTVPVRTLNNPAPAAGDAFGGSVAISGTRVLVGAPTDNTGATGAGSAYVYDLGGVTPTVPVRTLNNPEPGPAAGDRFGTFVAISGTRVVVCARGDDTGTFNAGSAYVYDLASGTPTVPVATLNNPDPADEDYFGWSAAISGARVVVGASRDDTIALEAGSVYAYDLISATPTVPVATLNNLNPPVGGDNFGNSVAISGTRVVVGAFLEDTGTPQAGSTYIYDLGSATPTVPVAALNNPEAVASDNFGSSVAISGTRVVVGAPGGFGPAASRFGSAYIYDLQNATPTVPVAILNNPGPAASDRFGNSVAISGTRLVVGAMSDDTGANNAGSAYVYDLNSATPTMPVATLNNPGPAADDSFGRSVAIFGTLVVVGAFGDNTGATDAGSVYVYDLSSASPTVPVRTLNNPGPAASDFFGVSVAISGTRIVVGAHLDDTGALNAGNAYVYDLGSATPTVPVRTLNNPDPKGNDLFGYSVALSDTRVVVGAFKDDAGTAYVYDLTSPTPTVPVAMLNNPAAAAGDKFGNSVAIDSTTIAIGTPAGGSGITDNGFAYIFAWNPADADGDGLLDGWEIARFGTTAGHRPLDDTDGDGRNELLELALSTDPLVPDAAAAPAVVDEDGFLTVTIAKQLGVTYEVQSAGTLLAGQPDSFSAATTMLLTNTPTTLKVRDTVPIGTAPARFLRTKVAAAP